jgi:UTP--glucose-1-phosphate uridylyltransferase
VKGVILAAGYGSRFLPVTKSIPKEMLPLINRPSIDFIVEEFIQSGIKDILIVSSRRKKVLEDYLDREVELEAKFQAENADAKLKGVKPHDARFFFTRQREMSGTGHALLLVKAFTENDPFVVAYPDDLILGEKPLARQLIESYEKTGCCVLATQHDPPNLSRYGILTLAEDGLHVADIVEKPEPGREPGKEASIGRYLFIPEIFKHLEAGLRKHGSGEYPNTFAINELARGGKVVFKRLEGTRLDLGEPAGFLRAIIKYAKTVPELAAVLRQETA